jgi:hypothetical protein
MNDNLLPNIGSLNRQNRTFIFYPEWLECINKFNGMEEKYLLMKMIIDYGCNGYYDA